MIRNINIILNEFTLHGQYKNQEEFYQNIKFLSDIINYVKEISEKINNIKVNLKKHNSILQKSLIITNSQQFQYEQIPTLKNDSYKVSITTLLKQFLAINSNNEKVILSPCSNIVYKDCSFTDIFGDNKDFYIFVSFSNSYYKNTQIKIYKEDMSDYRNIYFVNSIDNLKQIFQQNFYILDFDNSPQDNQTFLRYEEFKETKLKNQGRTVYYNESLSQYFVVDNLHKHGSSEIEIFGSNKSHLGTALSLEDFNLNSSTREERTLS